MDKDRLARRLMATFIAELEGHVRTFERDLLALEKDPTASARDELFGSLLRTAHSLKGAARSVKIDPVEAASHRLEEVLIAARDRRIVTDGGFYNVLLPTIDALGEAARRLAADGNLDDAPLAEALPQLSRLLAGELAAMPQLPPILEKVAKDTGKPPVKAATAPHAPLSTKPAEAVRVASDKLDALLRQSGELLIVRHRAEARTEDVAKLQDLLADWKKEWRQVDQGLAVLLKSEAAAEDQSEGGSNPDARRLGRMELAINRSRDGLWRLERGLQRFATDLKADRRAIEQTTGPLDALVRQTRMLPFAEACEGLERAVRDLVAHNDKKVDLVIEGREIELDRVVVENIKDPLLHLVRNAVDHGIEAVLQRRMAGKPDMGRITVAAALRGDRVEIKVADDGKGLDLPAIAARLRASDQPPPNDERELARSIFQPGFSTSPTVTQVSGRGVGLDIVKSRLAAIRGSADVNFEAGRGAVFSLSVPLTLTSTRAVMVGVGDVLYAIDTASVDRVVRIGADDMRLVGGREVLMLADSPVPVIALADVVGLSSHALTGTTRLPALILASDGRQAALVVDTLEAEREVVIRTLGRRLRRVKFVAGGTIQPDGRIALILNAAELVERAIAAPSAARLTDSADAAQDVARKRLLVVDDSVTIRTLEKSILEAAGYDVLVAADGQEAWQLLLETGADLVVSDVEMPRMDGFALTETIRASRRFRDLPVILVTAMESEADKARGMAVGANAYRVKSAFDQRDLLATIEQIL
jgi:two-component system chemotaxis sensor kinase CheA